MFRAIEKTVHVQQFLINHVSCHWQERNIPQHNSQKLLTAAVEPSALTAIWLHFAVAIANEPKVNVVEYLQTAAFSKSSRSRSISTILSKHPSPKHSSNPNERHAMHQNKNHKRYPALPFTSHRTGQNKSPHKSLV